MGCPIGRDGPEWRGYGARRIYVVWYGKFVIDTRGLYSTRRPVLIFTVGQKLPREGLSRWKAEKRTDGRKRAKRSISLFSIHWWIPCDSAYSSRRLHNGWLFREGITQRTKRREFENKEKSWADMLCERHIVLLLSLFFYFHTYYNVPTFDYSFCQDLFLSASGDAQRNRYVGRVGSYYSRHLLTKLGILLICSLIFSMQ